MTHDIIIYEINQVTLKCRKIERMKRDKFNIRNDIFLWWSIIHDLLIYFDSITILTPLDRTFALFCCFTLFPMKYPGYKHINKTTMWKKDNLYIFIHTIRHFYILLFYIYFNRLTSFWLILLITLQSIFISFSLLLCVLYNIIVASISSYQNINIVWIYIFY